MNLRLSTAHYCATLAVAMTPLLCWFVPATAVAEITDQEVIGFVGEYLQAAQQPTPDAEVDHYADRVRYFDDGTVSRAYIAQDQQRYYKRWPQRSFELLDEPVITENNGDAATVRFTIHYDVSGAGRHASGMTENTMRVQRFDNGLKIVVMSERKVRSGDVPRPSPKSRVESPTAKISPPDPAVKPSRPTSWLQPDNAPAVTENRLTPKRDAKAGKTEASRNEGKAAADALPQTATQVPGSPGLVYPPGAEHTPENIIDVRGYSHGQKVKDPLTGQIFLVP